MPFRPRTRSEVVKVAKLCIGTPYAHQGRQIGLGLDCGGVVVMVAKLLGYPYRDYPDYSRAPDGTFEDKLAESLDRVYPEDRGMCLHCHKPGDILCFRIHKEPQHVAVRTEYGIIHSISSSKVVQETSYDDAWRKRLVSVWEFPDLVDDVELLPAAKPSFVAVPPVESKEGCC